MNSDGVVVKFLLAEQEARDSIPNLTTTISEIGYLLLPSLNLAEISPKRRKSSEQQTRLEYNRQIFSVARTITSIFIKVSTPVQTLN